MGSEQGIDVWNPVRPYDPATRGTNDHRHTRKSDDGRGNTHTLDRDRDRGHDRDRYRDYDYGHNRDHGHHDHDRKHSSRYSHGRSRDRGDRGDRDYGKNLREPKANNATQSILSSLHDLGRNGPPQYLPMTSHGSTFHASVSGYSNFAAQQQHHAPSSYANQNHLSSYDDTAHTSGAFRHVAHSEFDPAVASPSMSATHGMGPLYNQMHEFGDPSLNTHAASGYYYGYAADGGSRHHTASSVDARIAHVSNAAMPSPSDYYSPDPVSFATHRPFAPTPPSAISASPHVAPYASYSTQSAYPVSGHTSAPYTPPAPNHPATYMPTSSPSVQSRSVATKTPAWDEMVRQEVSVPNEYFECVIGKKK